MTAPILPNALARKVFLDRHDLLGPASRGVGETLATLGFVQVDSVLTLARAHDHILWSRQGGYRPEALRRVLARREAFEHFTHDASVLPMEAFPHWRHRAERMRARMDRRWADAKGPEFRALLGATLDRIAAQGPIRSADLAEGPRASGGWWDWHPGKEALEYLWLAGDIAVTRREGFQKVYDLTERVIPEAVRAQAPTLTETLDWAGWAALDRLGFATPGEVAAFFALMTPQEGAAWAHAALASGAVEEVRIEGADGSLRRSLARPGLLAHAEGLPDLGARVRLLSPFDPALRDRARAERLWGFRYRIEIFVPAAKRTYGYYVFPVLEGTRLIGRTDVALRGGPLVLTAFWPEPGITMGRGRTERFMAELSRAARLAGAERVEVAPGWLR